MKTLTTFDLYSLVTLVGLFGYVGGMIIRGILAEINEENFRERIVEIHSAALREVNNLRKDIRNEMEVRKTAEALVTKLRAENNALLIHAAPVTTGGEPSFTEHVSTPLDMTSSTSPSKAAGLVVSAVEPKAVA